MVFIAFLKRGRLWTDQNSLSKESRGAPKVGWPRDSLVIVGFEAQEPVPEVVDGGVLSGCPPLVGVDLGLWDGCRLGRRVGVTAKTRAG
jgi:hypothetical protein